MKINEAIQQGEVYIKRLPDHPNIDGMEAMKEIDKGGYILSHSESGHHHILDGGTVLERPKKQDGMYRLFAILDEPQKVIQDASNPHGEHILPAGFYDIRISREYNPFLKEARRVAD